VKFKFLGTTSPMTAFGYDFTGGKTPDVVEPAFIAKLQGNAEFECVTDSTAEVKHRAPRKDKVASFNGIEPAPVFELATGHEE